MTLREGLAAHLRGLGPPAASVRLSSAASGSPVPCPEPPRLSRVGQGFCSAPTPCDRSALVARGARRACHSCVT